MATLGANAANAATGANTPGTIVKRDASGNFTAGTITASGLTFPDGSSIVPLRTPPQIAMLAWYQANQTATFAVGTNPDAVAFDGANIWVENNGSTTVTKLRTSDGANLRFAADESFARFNDRVDKQKTTFDTTTYSLVRRMKEVGPLSPLPCHRKDREGGVLAVISSTATRRAACDLLWICSSDIPVVPASPPSLKIRMTLSGTCPFGVTRSIDPRPAASIATARRVLVYEARFAKQREHLVPPIRPPALTRRKKS